MPDKPEVKFTPDFMLMQEVELDENGNMRRIIYRTPEELIMMAELFPETFRREQGEG